MKKPRPLNKAVTTFAVAGMAAVAASAVLTACGAAHGTGSISPIGTTNGTFHYCSYTPGSTGIQISRHEAVPCVVLDTRSRSDRKKAAHTRVPVVVSTHGSKTSKSSPGKSFSVKKSFGSKPKTSKH